MLQNLLSRVVKIVTSEIPAAKGKKSRRGNGKKAHLRHRSLQLESWELLSVSPMLPQEFESETELVAPMTMSMQAAASTTLSGATFFLKSPFPCRNQNHD